jgi:hypothetical protein
MGLGKDCDAGAVHRRLLRDVAQHVVAAMAADQNQAVDAGRRERLGNVGDHLMQGCGR